MACYYFLSTLGRVFYSSQVMMNNQKRLFNLTQTNVFIWFVFLFS